MSKTKLNSNPLKRIPFTTEARSVLTFLLVFVAILALIAAWHNNLGKNEFAEFNKLTGTGGQYASTLTGWGDTSDGIHKNLIDAGVDSAQLPALHAAYTAHSTEFFFSKVATIDKVKTDFNMLDSDSGVTTATITFGLLSIVYAVYYLVTGSKNKAQFTYSSLLLVAMIVTTLALACVDLNEFVQFGTHRTIVPADKIVETLKSLIPSGEVLPKI